LEAVSTAISAVMSRTVLTPMRPARNAAQTTIGRIRYAVGPADPTVPERTTAAKAAGTSSSAITSGRRATPRDTRCVQARRNGETTRMPARLASIRTPHSSAASWRRPAEPSAAMVKVAATKAPATAAATRTSVSRKRSPLGGRRSTRATGQVARPVPAAAAPRISAAGTGKPCRSPSATPPAKRAIAVHGPASCTAVNAIPAVGRISGTPPATEPQRSVSAPTATYAPASATEANPRRSEMTCRRWTITP
jgi:hypothetical protein